MTMGCVIFVRFPLPVDFFSIEIFEFESFPPYKIAGIKPLALNLFVEPDVALSLFIAFKLLI